MPAEKSPNARDRRSVAAADPAAETDGFAPDLSRPGDVSSLAPSDAAVLPAEGLPRPALSAARAGRPAGSPAITREWLITCLRWLFVVSALVAIAVDPARDAHSHGDLTALAGVVLFVIGTQFVLTLLQALQVWPRGVAATGVFIDALAALAYYSFYAGPGTPLLFVGLLPIVVAALTYSRVFSLTVAVIVIVSYVSSAVLQSDVDAAALATISVNTLLLMIAAGGLDFLASLARAELDGADPPAAAPAGRGPVDSHAHLRASTNRVRERVRAIYDMAATLSATLNYEKVLETALDVCEIGMSEFAPNAGRMVGMVLLFEEDELQIVASRHLTRSDVRVRITGAGRLIPEALSSAEPVLTALVAEDADLNQIAALQDCKSVVALPLRAGFENYGVAVFGTPPAGAFGEEQLELLTAVANQATIALQNARLYQSLREEKERIIEVDEDARKKLARDLHDGPTQNVAAIAMRTNFALRLLDREPQKAGEELRKIEELARQTTREMRHMLFILRPLVLESQGLTAALQQLADKLRETYGQNVIIEATPFEAQVDAGKQGVAFYIVEEALGNARKHAQAQHIWVRLGLRGDLFIIQIEDDGVGFDVGAVEGSYDRRGSLGMVNMRERAALVSGNLHIESAPGKGTRITVAVPLTEAARERLHHGGEAPPPDAGTANGDARDRRRAAG